jgi:hypothetical protein
VDGSCGGCLGERIESCGKEFWPKSGGFLAEAGGGEGLPAESPLGSPLGPPLLLGDRWLAICSPPVEAFVAQISKLLLCVVTCRPPIWRRAKSRLPATEDGLPRQSMRVAAQGRSCVSNLEV